MDMATQQVNTQILDVEKIGGCDKAAQGNHQ